jgi:hypothetical protein
LIKTKEFLCWQHHLFLMTKISSASHKPEVIIFYIPSFECKKSNQLESVGHTVFKYLFWKLSQEQTRAFLFIGEPIFTIHFAAVMDV